MRRTTPRPAALLLALAAALILGACGAPQPRVYRIGILSGLEFLAPAADGFKAGMADLGYVEGKNVTYEVKSAGIDMAAYRTILKGFVDEKVDLIMVFPTEAAAEAKAATAGTSIPVVFAYAVTEGADLVKSVREPGGNITGVRYPNPDVALKRLEMLLAIAPKTKRVLVPYLDGYPTVPSQLEALRPAAAAAGVALVEDPAASVDALGADLQRRAGQPDAPDAVLMLVEPLILTPGAFAHIAAYSAATGAPSGGVMLTDPKASSLFGVFVDPAAAGREAAPLADKALRGTPAGTIPVTTSDPVVQVNLRQAQAMGLTVPDGLLRQAKEIVR